MWITSPETFRGLPDRVPVGNSDTRLPPSANDLILFFFGTPSCARSSNRRRIYENAFYSSFCKFADLEPSCSVWHAACPCSSWRFLMSRFCLQPTARTDAPRPRRLPITAVRPTGHRRTPRWTRSPSPVTCPPLLKRSMASGVSRCGKQTKGF